MTFDRNFLSDFGRACGLEWLETNGLGGYASGTAAGALTRRYHGVLIAALEPPVKRTVLLAKLDETLVIGDDASGAQRDRYELGSNQYPGAVHPTGFRHLERFERDLFPVFYYEAGGIQLKKTIAAVHGENTTLVLYEVLGAGEPFILELMPLASSRDHHGISHANDAIGRQYLFDDGVFRTLNYQGGAEVFISIPGSSFTPAPGWYYNFEYAVEQSRGLEFHEDLYTHGVFKVLLRRGDHLGVIVSADDPSGRDAFTLFEQERRRREGLVAPFARNGTAIRALALAADQFIVRRGQLNTIIAGYPWFSDWGRDTMISLPGLCLSTGRYSVAKNILLQFAEFISMGMLPNRFPDHGERPEYNTFDATLWFFHAIYLYYRTTGDLALVKELLPALSDIVDCHRRGTRFSIGVDPVDGLLRGGQPGLQLTWMDAKVGDWVVTPRIGKPVEINALWYNALCIMQVFNSAADRPGIADHFRAMAEEVSASFGRLFWNGHDRCLYDYIDEIPHAEIRPNQLYALSLPFPLLEGTRARSVIDTVRNQLLTPRGLRSLAPGFPGYAGRYGGDQWHRDGAYHQGTVWSHLIGTYIDALMRFGGAGAREEAARLLASFCEHLGEAGIGTVSEIFDGDPPHAARGCIAQAWSVAEVLRVTIQYELPLDIPAHLRTTKVQE